MDFVVQPVNRMRQTRYNNQLHGWLDCKWTDMRPDAKKSKIYIYIYIAIYCCIHFLRRVYVCMDSGPVVPPVPPAGKESSCIEKGVMVIITILDFFVYTEISTVTQRFDEYSWFFSRPFLDLLALLCQYESFCRTWIKCFQMTEDSCSIDMLLEAPYCAHTSQKVCLLFFFFFDFWFGVWADFMCVCVTPPPPPSLSCRFGGWFRRPVPAAGWRAGQGSLDQLEEDTFL